jgi:Holliday junction resolvase RusA-like endonuclease
MFKLWVPGTPLPQPRPRARAIWKAGKPVAHVYNPSTADPWKREVRAIVAEGLAAGRIEKINGPVHLVMHFALPAPKMLAAQVEQGMVWGYKKPDIDNLVKSTMDAMEGCWHDDAQVVSFVAMKRYRKNYHGVSLRWCEWSNHYAGDPEMMG